MGREAHGERLNLGQTGMFGDGVLKNIFVIIVLKELQILHESQA